jgi:SAM-dependent methyltransferase
VLDLPAGDGHFGARLAAAGHEVVSADLFPEHCTAAPGAPVRADMNAPLPFPDDSFDAVVCQEGVEHLENVAGFLGEVRRVLRHGGHLWLTLPNHMDLSARVAFLFSGRFSARGELPNEQSTLWGTDGERAYHGHAFTLPWFQLRYLLRLSRFDDIRLAARGSSATSRILWPLLRVPIGVSLRRGLKRRQRKLRARGRRAFDDAMLQTLWRDGVSRALLCGKGLLVHARLREGSLRG